MGFVATNCKIAELRLSVFTYGRTAGADASLRQPSWQIQRRGAVYGRIVSRQLSQMKMALQLAGTLKKVISVYDGNCNVQ